MMLYKKGFIIVVACALLTGCQTSYYPATKDHATKGTDGVWRGSIMKEGVPDWSPGKALNVSGLKAGL